MKENNIQNHLTKIQQFIQGDLPVDLKSFEVFNSETDKQIQSIKKHLKEELLHSDEAFERNLIFVQVSVQQLLTAGLYRLSSLESFILDRQHMNDCMNRLIDLLDDLQLHHGQCFKFDFNAPELYVQAKQREMTSAVLQLKNEFKGKIEDKLELVLNSCVYIISGVPTYQQIVSFKDRIHALKEVETEDFKTNIDTPVVLLLLKTGLDTFRFLEFCIKRIENQTIHTVEEMENFLSEWHQALLVADYYAAINKSDNSIVSILEKALKRKSRLVHQALDRDGSVQRPYFHVATSLVQLLYFFKLWIDTGVLKCENRSGLYHFIHRYIETDRTAHPTVGSMQRKYGTAKKSDKIKVKNLLIAMLNQINQELSSANP